MTDVSVATGAAQARITTQAMNDDNEEWLLVPSKKSIYSTSTRCLLAARDLQQQKPNDSSKKSCFHFKLLLLILFGLPVTCRKRDLKII